MTENIFNCSKSPPSVRLFNGERVLQSELCVQAKNMGESLEFTGRFVSQYILPFDGIEDCLIWKERR